MNAKRIFSILVCAAVLVFAILPGTVRVYTKTSVGDACVRCGARKYVRNLNFFGLRIWSSSEYSASALTRVYIQLQGECPHDWTRAHSSSRSLGGAGFHACSFPQFDYPAVGKPEELASGIQMLATPQSQRAALESIGRTNLLRWIAAETLYELADQPASNLSGSSMETWWGYHSNSFNICTNLDEAKEILKQIARTNDTSGVAFTWDRFDREERQRKFSAGN